MRNIVRVGSSRVFFFCLAALALLVLSCASTDMDVATETREGGPVQVTFNFMPEGRPGGVYLAGTFNNWDAGADRMEDTDGDGIYEITLMLEPGNYQYKFVIDGAWKEDPHAESYADDGYGGKNSVLDVPENVAAMTVGVDAGKKLTEAKAVAPGAAVPVTFLFEAGGPATVYLAGTFNGWEAAKDLMTDDDGDGIYEITLELRPGRYEYKFVRDGQWLTDESADDFADDGYGGKNSVLHVPEDAGKALVVGMVETIPEELADKGERVGTDLGAEKVLKQVTFRFQPVISGVENVFLAGTFNDWNDSKTRMTDEDGDGAYQVTLLLPVGRYQYKFVADGNWITDENAAEFTDDGFGGQNSVIIVDDSFEDVTIELGDGKMMHRDIPLVLDYSMVNPLSRERVSFTARAHRDDVEEVALVYSVDGGAEEVEVMKPVGKDAVFQYYAAVLEVSATSKIRFSFRYTDGDGVFYARPGGVRPGKPSQADMFEYSPDTLEPFYTPDWAKDGVFYQIFPERFRNGDTSNDQDFTEPYYEGVTTLPASGKTNGEYFHFVSQWSDVSGLTRSPYRTDGRPDYYSFYGGDIAGVMEKLPYLADLGVTIIYFNPLNEARSNHKYDAMDYLKIDPHFASDATFKEFVRRAHEHGIRIIVDMALNHTGNYHFAFLDGKEKGRESHYWDWYEWKRWPLPEGDIPNPLDYYDCWWGFGIHPNLNFDLSRPNDQENGITDASQAQPNTDLVEYLLEIPRYWIGELGIDGFRLDVPNEVPFWFWEEFRGVVDEMNPDAFLIGEIWGNAMPWLGPHYFHSTMNYKYFRDPVLRFFGMGQGNASQLDRELAPGRSLYPIQATQVMMNLIDSHDTERFVTVAKDDRRLMLAALFQMTYVGIPQIYYGDEVGLKGGKDPDCRRTFPWNWEEVPRRTSIHDYYRKIIGIRRTFTALRTGSFETVLTEGKVYAFLREDDENRIVVVLNNEEQPKSVELYLDVLEFADGTRFIDQVGGGEYTVRDSRISIDCDPLSGAVLVAQ